MSAKKSAKTKSELAKKAPEPATETEAKVSKSVEKKPKKVSALDAAARVLGEAKEPMTCQEIIKVMAEKGFWTSPGGKTPWGTLCSAMLREIGKKGKGARFKKMERGKFAANS